MKSVIDFNPAASIDAESRHLSALTALAVDSKPAGRVVIFLKKELVMVSFIRTVDQLTGNKLMDDDHERILHKINALLESIDFHSGQPSHEMRTQLDKLIVLTRAHFEREEAEMKRINYTASSAHRAEHAALLIEIAAFRAALESNERIDCAGVHDFFSKWWCAHILGADMRLAATLEGSTAS